jgi:hypothetical protein
MPASHEFTSLKRFDNDKRFQGRYDRWVKKLEEDGSRVLIVKQTTHADSVMIEFRMIPKATRPRERE